MHTPQYSLIHQSDTARLNGEDAIVLTRKGIGSVVRESYDGRVSVL